MAKAKKIKIGFIKKMLLTTEALRYQATLMRLWNCSMLYKDALSALADEQHNFQVAMIKSKSRKEMKEIKAEHVKKIEKIRDHFRYSPAYLDDRIVQEVNPTQEEKNGIYSFIDSNGEETKIIIKTETKNQPDNILLPDEIYLPRPQEESEYYICPKADREVRTTENIK